MRMLRLLLSGLVLVSLAGCDNPTLQQLTGAVTGAATAPAGKVKVTGKVFAPSDQVAIIASGALNYGTLARSDESGVKGATLKLTELGGSESATAQTSDTGTFTLNVSPNKAYSASATFTAKDGKAVTLSGLVAVDGTGGTLTLDIAHNLVASKALKGGLKKLDGAKLTGAVAAMQSDLETVSKAPAPTTQAEAASQFDALASAATKALVTALGQ